jgi:hypothetical protein
MQLQGCRTFALFLFYRAVQLQYSVSWGRVSELQLILMVEERLLELSCAFGAHGCLDTFGLSHATRHPLS